MVISEFREKCGNAVAEIEKLDQNSFNIFKVLRLTNTEIRHSYFLKWLFSQREFQKAFLKNFMQLAHIAPETINVDENFKVNTEEFFYEINEENFPVYQLIRNKKVYYRINGVYYTITTPNQKKKNSKKEEEDDDDTENIDESYDSPKVRSKLVEIDPSKVSFGKNEKTTLIDLDDKFTDIGRRIDINLIGNNFTITIENKIYTGEHDFQCVAYRNYMLRNEKYGRDKKKHYFVYLAPDKPDDFDDECDLSVLNDEPRCLLRYPGYVFMDYQFIADILEFDPNVKKELEQSQDCRADNVDQYVSILREMKKTPPEYKAVFVKMRDNLYFFSNNDVYLQLINSEELTKSEKYFAYIARRYCLEVKSKIDDIIYDCLRDLSIDEYFLHEYENYAFSVPLSFDALNFSEKLEYLKNNPSTAQSAELAIAMHTKGANLPNSLQKELKSHIDSYEDSKDRVHFVFDELTQLGKISGITYDQYKALKGKRGKEKKAKRGKIDKVLNGFETLQTVDYRAFINEFSMPSISIGAGHKKRLSESLCSRLTEDSLVSSIKTMLETDPNWSVSMNLYFKGGAGFIKGHKELPCNAAAWLDTSADERTRLLNPDNIFSDKRASDIFCKTFLGYLRELKEKGLVRTDLYTDLFSLNMAKWMQFIVQYFTSSRADITKCSETLDSLLNINDHRKQFESWIKAESDQLSENKLRESLFDLTGEELEQKTFDILLLAIRIDLFKKWVDTSTFAEWEKNNPEFKKKLLKLKAEKKIKNVKISDIVKKLLSYSCIKLIFSWNFAIIYKLEGIIDWIYEPKITDEEITLKTAEIKPQLMRIFREKTIEGVSPFGYGKWFDQKIFKKLP